jgi:hypothetical protein
MEVFASGTNPCIQSAGWLINVANRHKRGIGRTARPDNFYRPWLLTRIKLVRRQTKQEQITTETPKTQRSF